MEMSLYGLTFSWTSILLAAVLCLVAYIRYAFTYWSRRGVKTPPPRIPLGDVAYLINNEKCFGEVFRDIYFTLKHQGENFGGTYTFISPVFIPISNDLVKRVLQSDYIHFGERGFYVNERDDPLTGNLFNLTFDKWKPLRSKLTPTFTTGKIKSMFQTVKECAQNLEDLLEHAHSKGEQLNFDDITSRFNTDVIGSCAFGIQVNSLKNPEVEFHYYGKQVFKPSVRGLWTLMMPHWFLRLIRFKQWHSSIEDFFMDLAKDTVNHRESNNVTRHDFVDLLLQLKNNGYVASDDKLKCTNGNDNQTKVKITLNELIAQCFVFFNAGFETSATTTLYALYELAVNQDVQEKVRQEIESVLEKNGGELTYEGIAEMKYLEQVFCETLRKYPPLTILNRVCTKDYTVPGTSLIVKKGTMVIVPVMGIHYDPDYYPDPDKFQPERFSEENKRNRHACTWLPFGEGPRICIGLRFGFVQVKVGLATIISKYRVSLSKNMKTPLEFEPHNFILTPKGGIWLDISKIK